MRKQAKHRLYAKQFVRRQRTLVLDNVTKSGVVLIPDWSVEAAGAYTERAKLVHLGRRNAQVRGQLCVTWFVAESLRECAIGPMQFVNPVHDMNGQSNRLGLVREGATDGLLDP